MKKSLLIFLSAFLLSAFGLLMIYSSSHIWSEYKFNDPYYYVRHQLIFFFIGLILIYFIRKKDNIDSSYITARYSLRYSDTVEYRRKNNCIVKDESDIAVIKQITKIITNYLQKGRE